MLLWPLIILCHCLLVVETVKLLQSKQPTTLTIKLTTGFKDQMLMQARIDHAAGVVTDEVTTEKLVIVTGGEHNGILLDSTEMTIQQSMECRLKD